VEGITDGIDPNVYLWIVTRNGGEVYDRDSLNDELPYWLRVNQKPHLVIPYVPKQTRKSSPSKPNA
jgi:hypothetical protein